MMVKYRQPKLLLDYEATTGSNGKDTEVWRLPESWAWMALSEIADIIMGQSPPGHSYNYRGEGLPFFQGKAEFGEFYPTAKKWCTEPKKVAEPGDILISVRAPVGPTNLCRETCCIGRGLAAIRPYSEIGVQKYLLYALRSLEETIAGYGQGSTFQAISKRDLQSFDIPIPYPDDPNRSLAEQHRIVARLETLLSEVRESRKINDEIKADTDRLMDAVIQEVFDHPNRNWKTKELSDVALVQTGTAKGRRFGGRKTIELPYLRVANVQAGYLKLDEIKTIRIAEDEIERYKLETGDLLLTEGGDFDKLGRGAVWRGEIELCIHQNHVFAVRFNQSEVFPEFAEYEMQSWYAKTYFLSVAKRTTNLASINKTQLSAFPIRYPPKKEQQSIVKHLDTVKAEVEAMQQIQTQDEQSLGQVEQAILAQAFRGKL